MKLYKAVAIIPAYNEEKNIEETIRRIKRVKGIKRVVVVDDGSKDRTAELAKKSGAIVIKYKTNKGKGEALKIGLKYILKKPEKYIIIIDADLQYDPKDSEKILKPLLEDKADFVMGYRNFKKIPFRHRLGNLVWKTSFNLFFGTNLKDTNCGLMGLKKEIIKSIKKIECGYTVENSILSELIKKKIRILQVPVKVYYKKTSKILRGIRVVLCVFLFILREGLKYRLESIKKLKF